MNSISLTSQRLSPGTFWMVKKDPPRGPGLQMMTLLPTLLPLVLPQRGLPTGATFVAVSASKRPILNSRLVLRLKPDLPVIETDSTSLLVGLLVRGEMGMCGSVIVSKFWTAESWMTLIHMCYFVLQQFA